MSSSYSWFYLKKKKNREGECANTDTEKSQEDIDKMDENYRENNYSMQNLNHKNNFSNIKNFENSKTHDFPPVNPLILDEFHSVFMNGIYNYYWKVKIPRNAKLEKVSFKKKPQLDTILLLELFLNDKIPKLVLTFEKIEPKLININENTSFDEHKNSENSDINDRSLTLPDDINLYNHLNNLNIYNQYFIITQRLDITYKIFTYRQDICFKDIQIIDKRIDERELNNEILNQVENEDLFILIEISMSTKYVRRNDPERTFGYVGIVNEGMTCYMNSLLQTLNILSAFKKAVFQIPTISDDYDNSISLSLQRLFYDLMKDEYPVSTSRLTNSFGWGREQIQEQHDVQEFNLVLSDAMERKMKNTKLEGTFSNLFEGSLINYIHCIDVDYKRIIEEKFCDIQLTIKV